MTKLERIALFFKGMAMGTVDIVPGVSGSTVAVLLGIYERFIASLKNIDLKLMKAAFAPFTHKFSKESRQAFSQTAKDADLPWLLTLLAGLAAAFITASLVIPTLMTRFPEIMRGVFFGLVLGSIITPIRTIKKWRIPNFIVIALFAAGFYFILGQHFTPPAQLVSFTATQGDTLESICLSAPCFNSPAEILALPENAPLLQAGITPQTPLNEALTVTITQPYLPYCILAGFLAICAMLLPGISGSFIMLVLGCYFFMLNTGKGFISGLTHGNFHPTHLLYLGCVVLGAVTGIALFSRTLTWLLKKYRELTLSAIIGILLGCLRAVWPYRTSGVDSQNIIPTLSTPLFWPTIIAIFCGLGVVIATICVQKKLNKDTPE